MLGSAGDLGVRGLEIARVEAHTSGEFVWLQNGERGTSRS